MKQRARRNKIALLGPFSFGNLGNAALQQVLLQHLSKRFPEAEFYGCYIDPEAPAAAREILPFSLDGYVLWPVASVIRHTKNADSGSKLSRIHERIMRTPLLGDLWNAGRTIWFKAQEVQQELVSYVRAYRFVREFRLLVFGLGGLFDEVWGGKWGDLYSYFRWAVLARLAGTPLVCLSVGVEEVNSRLGRFFCKTVLLLASYRSFRDVESKEKVEAMGVRGDNRVFPDLAFGLETKNSFIDEADRRGRNVVGVSPMPYCDPRFWPIKDLSAYQRYLTILASFVSWILRNTEYEVVLFPTQIRMDRIAIEELKALVLKDVPPSMHPRLTDADVRGVSDCMALLSRLNMAVTSRLHGVILSHLTGTPVLAVSPAGKIDRLMEDMNLKEYVLNIRELDLPLLVERFRRLEANRESVQRDTHCKVAGYRKDVDAQFDLLFRTSGILDLDQ